MDYRQNVIEGEDAIVELLGSANRVAVLGIKTEQQAGQPSYDVPAYLAAHGYEIVPVPVYYPEVQEILGHPVYRTVSDVPGDIDIVEVFRRPQDIPPHVDDLIAKHPDAVWFQLGIRNDAAAEQLARAGIKVVQDRCMLVEHRKLSARRAAR